MLHGKWQLRALKAKRAGLRPLGRARRRNPLIPDFTAVERVDVRGLIAAGVGGLMAWWRGFTHMQKGACAARLFSNRVHPEWGTAGDHRRGSALQGA